MQINVVIEHATERKEMREKQKLLSKQKFQTPYFVLSFYCSYLGMYTYIHCIHMYTVYTVYKKKRKSRF